MLLLPLVDKADNFGDFLIGHHGGDGEGELLGVDLLGDREGEVVELRVAFLTVGRDGVVDDGLHAVVGEIFLQLVAALGTDREDVEHVGVGIGNAGEYDCGVGDAVDVHAGYLFAAGVVGVEVTELNVEHCGLDFVEAGVAADVAEYVFACGAVVGEGTDGACELFVVGGDGSGVAECAEVFAGVEAVAGGVAERSGAAAVEEASVGLGVVFDEFEIVLLADAADLVGVGALAVEVHDHDGAGAGGDGCFDARGVDLIGGYVGLHEDGHEAVFGDGEDGCYVGVGGDDDFVAGLHDAHFDVGAEYPDECVEAVGAAYGIAGADVVGIVFFKLFVLFALEIPAGVDYAADCLTDFVAVACGDFLKIKKFYHDGMLMLLLLWNTV